MQAFQRIKIFESIAFKEFDYRVLENKTIHSTIRCHNRAGLFSSKSSDGVKISVQHPSIRNAKISVIPLSITEYQAWSHYQSKIQNVRIQWSGFDDYTGINQFKVYIWISFFKRQIKFYFKIEKNENVFNCFIRFWLVLNILVLTFI